MRAHLFETKMWLPATIDEAFEFFSNASNLDAITPAWLHFEIVTPSPVKIREGALIDYKLRIRGIPVRWLTRIDVWEPPHRFVDEQIRGPYRQWVHEHVFAERDGGTIIVDKVTYAVPFDWLVHRWLVRPDVERIFQFRTVALKKRFGGS